MKEFQLYGCYFLLRYIDDSCVVPTITTLFYVGLNLLSNEDGADLWFFQDGASYIRTGPIKLDGSIRDATDLPGDVDAQIWEFPVEQIDEVLSRDELVTALLRLGNV